MEISSKISAESLEKNSGAKQGWILVGTIDQTPACNPEWIAKVVHWRILLMNSLDEFAK